MNDRWSRSYGEGFEVLAGSSSRLERRNTMEDDFLDASQSPAEQTHKSPIPSELMDIFGGEPLEGSGFESEVPDSIVDWRGSE
jgi:hypothetical protein